MQIIVQCAIRVETEFGFIPFFLFFLIYSLSGGYCDALTVHGDSTMPLPHVPCPGPMLLTSHGDQLHHMDHFLIQNNFILSDFCYK